MQSLAEFVTKVVSIEDEVVTIKKLSAADQTELEKIQNPIELAILFISRSVLRWSFKNIDGQPLAVTKENILRMRADIIILLGKEIIKYNGELLEAAKNG